MLSADNYQTLHEPANPQEVPATEEPIVLDEPEADADWAPSSMEGVEEPATEQPAEVEVPEGQAEEQAPEGEVSEQPTSEETPSMAELLEESFDFWQPRRGEIRKGVIISIGEDGAVVDVGLKREAIVYASDLERLGPEGRAELQEGQEVYVAVLRPSDREGNLVVSIAKAREEQDWVRAQEDLESGRLLELVPTEYNRGGVVVQYGKIRGFVPASQLMHFPRRLSQAQKAERLRQLVERGEPIPLKVLEVDRRRRRLILSQRQAWFEWKEHRKRTLLENLEVGQEVEGTVTSLRDFGAFVDLGGADGLVHVSELSWHHVDHPKEVLEVGQKVRVKVVSLDRERMRIGLSLKQMQPEPWSHIEELYTEGQLVEGVVTRVVEFGAFVRLPEGIEGLVHVSELADIEPERPQDLVNEGDLLLLRVIRIEPERRRIGLSLRQVTEEEWEEWAASFEEPAKEAEEEAEVRVEEPELAAAGEPAGAVEETEVEEK